MELEKLKTLVIIAALNEEQAIGRTISEINLSLDRCKCLVVDGQSNDRTVDIAKSSMAEVIPQNGLGKGDAFATAIEYSKGMDMEYVAMIDADFTYPAHFFPDMIDILDKYPEVGMVCGNRFHEMDSNMMPEHFLIGNRMLAFVHKVMNGINLKDPFTGLRVMRREIVNNWVPKSKEFDIEVELNILVKKKGYEVVEIPINYRRRIGVKKLKPIHGFRILKRIMLQSFSSQ
ncbi:glycosyltransferase [bacterium]|nr:MAG: glycosyltransferase [bacterium]